MDTTDQPFKKQALLYVGSRVRDEIERLAQAGGQRWQDLARQILKDFISSRTHEDALKSEYGWTNEE